LSLIPLFALALAGCGGDPMHLPKPASSIDVPQAEYNLSPRQLYDAAKRASAELSLPVESEKSGTFITGYKEYPGEWHIARRWQERTRFRVSVIPDFDNPTGKARLEVAEETQTREADGMSWKQMTEVNRPERAKELLRQIQQQLGSASSGGAAQRPASGAAK
jgi:hypothetical protein